jgi:hypothetical protein
MRLEATNPQPFQLDVAATSSSAGLLPKIGVDPAVAAQGTGRFMRAIQDSLRNKLKGHTNFRIVPMARRSHSHGREIHKVAG